MGQIGIVSLRIYVVASRSFYEKEAGNSYIFSDLDGLRGKKIYNINYAKNEILHHGVQSPVPSSGQLILKYRNINYN